MNTSTDTTHFNILLADDGSQHSQSAVALISDLTLPAPSKVFVLAVLTPRESSNHSYLENSLSRSQSALQAKGLQVETQLKLGYPAEEIIEHANQRNPDLIVLGAQGLRSTLGILLGGVAQQVVEYANWPVLVVRAPYQGLRKILLVTDGSPHSHSAVEFLAASPFPRSAQLTLMHVLLPKPSPEFYVSHWPVGPEVLPPLPPSPVGENGTYLDEEENAGKMLLGRLSERLSKFGWHTTQVLRRGDAATEIMGYTRENQVDMIIAGSRGLSPVRGWLLGSVSRKLVHYAGCSVLIVKQH